MRTRHVLAVGILWLLPIRAFAQAAPPPAREVTADLSFVGTSGNSSTQSIGIGGALIQRLDPWELTMKTAYIRNESASTLQAESFSLALGGARALSPRVSLFVRHGYLRDRFAGIDNRNNPEGGVSYIAITTTPHKLVVDAAVGYANEVRVTGPDLSSGTGAIGALYTLKISDTSDFTDDWRAVVALDQIKDRRIANVASVSARLTSIFSLKVSNTIRFVNVPTPGFEKTDSITAIALVVKF
jgi:putative salt-induced outer membrane protein YdiY